MGREVVSLGRSKWGGLFREVKMGREVVSLGRSKWVGLNREVGCYWEYMGCY